MNFLFYRYNSVCEPYMIESLQKLGHTIKTIDTEITYKDIAAEKIIEIVSNSLITEHFDAVISVNYYPVLSEICRIFKLDMLELLEQNTPLASCYFADNDNIAIGAMKAFQHKGYKIPADISIIGFDNMPLSTSVIPALSTIHVPKQNLGKTAAERLINVIESDEYYSVKIEISATYIARKSVI